MKKERRKSREEWEQELWEKQVNLTRGAPHITPGETFNTAELVRLLLGAVLVALGIVAPAWTDRYSPVFTLTAVAVGLCLIVTTLIGRRRKSG